MLWYKGWLETRIRLLFLLGLFCLFFFQVGSRGLTPPAGIRVAAGGVTLLVAMICIFLAGAGINTQAAFRGARGLHGSTLFTLSLPVSRLRLLAVRVSLGWLEMAGAIGALCFGMWILFPAGAVTAAEMIEYVGTLIGCASGLYSISVLLATFLDDQWRIYGSAIVFAALWWLQNHTPFPVSANIFRAMGEGSPVLAHTLPWAAMAFSVGLAAILFLAALKVVQSREY